MNRKPRWIAFHRTPLEAEAIGAVRVDAEELIAMLEGSDGPGPRQT